MCLFYITPPLKKINFLKEKRKLELPRAAKKPKAGSDQNYNNNIFLYRVDN